MNSFSTICENVKNNGWTLVEDSNGNIQINQIHTVKIY